VNLGQMVSETLANGFDPVFFGRDRIVQFLNDGHQYVCAQTNYTGDEAVLDFATAQGSDTYPQPADMSDLRSLRDVDRHFQLHAVSLRKVDRMASTPGRPTHYALNGANFQLWPVPDGVYNLECRYWLIPPLMVLDTDTPIVPPMWHWLVWTWAVAQCFRAEDDVQRAGTWDARFAKGLSDFTASVKFSSDMPTRAESMWAPRASIR